MNNHLQEDNYISERLDQYIKYYDTKSVRMKGVYLQYRAIVVVGGALIPVFTNIEQIPYKDYLVSIIGLIVVVLVSLDSVYHWGDQWRNFRSTEQVLGREKVFYSLRRGPYKDLTDSDALGLLVERCEEAIAVENTATLNTLSIQQANAKEKNSLSSNEKE